ncbi:MAG: hypothetical protein M5U01_36005 [Ardenticatenaceae bacterium]|nr:hypothetical protein [Ardenticatenaceae bacterium]HBY97562.1 hypothetical protein [Chloroflexota bacterium]
MKALTKEQVPQETIAQYWRISLALGATVLTVVALLLNTVAKRAEEIQTGAAEIWRIGKLIANNTVHIAMLGHINQIVAEILQTADGIAQATERIERTATATHDEKTG